MLTKEETEGNLRTLFADRPHVPLATSEERAAWAEKRHLFWRNRSLEHARTIDRLEKHICHLSEVIRTLEKRIEKLGGEA